MTTVMLRGICDFRFNTVTFDKAFLHGPDGPDPPDTHKIADRLLRLTESVRAQLR